MQGSAADWRTSLQLRRMRALLWGRVLDAKLQALDRAIKAFDPNQPRVPAGNPDGGQWTDGGGGGSDATADVRVAQARRDGRGRGSDAEATPAQLARRDIAEAQARATTRRVQEIEPNWRPQASLCWQSAANGSLLFQFPDLRQNTGKFRKSRREGRKTARFPDYKSASYTQIPYAPEQGIFWS